MSTPSLIQSLLSLKCPRCRKGNLFNKSGLFRYNEILEMPERCSHCGQKYEIENGFWIGAMWISYPIVVAIEMPFLLLALFAEDIMTWVYFALMIVSFIIFSPFILRFGRALWIYVNVPFDKSGNHLKN